MKKFFLILMLCFSFLKFTNAQCWNPYPKDSAYHMGFEISDTTDFYTNWKVGIDSNYYDASWTIYGDSGVGYHSQYAIGISEYDNYWMFSRCFKLKADSAYLLSYWYKVAMPDLLNQNLKVEIGNSHNAVSMTRTLLNLDSITNNNYKQANIVFTVPSTGDYNFGWLPYGNYMIDDSYMFIDSITLGKYVCDSLKPAITATKYGICKNSGDSIQLTATSGYSSYLWTTNHELRTSGASSIWATDTGKYVVKVTNASGCYGVDTVTITQFSLPHIRVSTSTSKRYICGNNNLTLNVTNLSPNDSLAYTWNNGTIHTPSLTIDTAGLYTVIGIDSNGCKAYDTIPIIKASKCGICSGSHIPIQINAGKGYFSYNWNNGASFDSLFDVTTPGKVIVTLLASGNFTFIAVDSINIQDYTLPDIKIQTATGKNYLCGSDSLLLNAVNFSGTGIVSYKWNNKDSLFPYFYAKSAGKDSVICADSNGCKNKDSIQLLLSPAPNLTLFCHK